MFCKNRITLIGFLGKDTETRVTAKGTAYSRFSIATNVSWKDKESGEYRTRTEWHACVVWAKLGEWAASLKKGAFVEVEGELRYREFQPKGSETKVRAAEIHVSSILMLDRAEKPSRRRTPRPKCQAMTLPSETLRRVSAFRRGHFSCSLRSGSLFGGNHSRISK